MALYDRMMGLSPSEGSIPVHQFVATMAEFGRGEITGAQAQEHVAFYSDGPLSPEGVSEAQALLASIAGSATAKLARVKLIDDVLILAQMGAPGYESVAQVKTRLGV